MGRRKNRIGIIADDHLANFLPSNYATYGQRLAPETYGPTLYLPDITSRSRRRSRRQQRRGGLVALLFGLIEEHWARRTLDREADFESRDGPSSYRRGEDEFETRERARMEIGDHRDDSYRRTVLRDDSTQQEGNPPSYEAAMKSS